MESTFNMNKQVVSETSISRDQIALMAYEVWNKAGRPQGRDWEFWFEAERQLLASTKPASTAPAATTVKASPAPATTRETTVPPVARMEPARVQSTPAQTPKKTARRFGGLLGGSKSRN